MIFIRHLKYTASRSLLLMLLMLTLRVPLSLAKSSLFAMFNKYTKNP